MYLLGITLDSFNINSHIGDWLYKEHLESSKNHFNLYLLMAVDLVSKPTLSLLSYALISELIVQSYSLDSHMIIIGVCGVHAVFY